MNSGKNVSVNQHMAGRNATRFQIDGSELSRDLLTKHGEMMMFHQFINNFDKN